MDIFKEALQNNTTKKAAFCLIVAHQGSTPRKVGTKMLVYEDGEIFGTIGGGNLEKKTVENAIQQIKLQQPKLFKHDLLHQHSMCCGGSVSIYIEPIVNKKRLYIFGAGHTGEALANFASKMDFEVFIIDDRKSYLDNIKINGINKINLEYSKVLPSLPFSVETFITIMTYEHSFDRDILSYCINQPHAYLGMIGSERKVILTKKIFLDGNISSKEQLEKVDMPMGYSINAETPEEIAVSILAKMIEVKNNGTIL